MSTKHDEPLSVPLVWTDNPDSPIMFANQILIQHPTSYSEFILSFGQVAPPPILTIEQTEKFLGDSPEVEVKTIVRLGVTPERLVEFIKVLQTGYRNYQEAQARK
jgi:hypothetical protein